MACREGKCMIAEKVRDALRSSGRDEGLSGGEDAELKAEYGGAAQDVPQLNSVLHTTEI